MLHFHIIELMMQNALIFYFWIARSFFFFINSTKIYKHRLSIFIWILLLICFLNYDIVKIVLTVKLKCLLGHPWTAVLNSLTSVKSKVYFEFKHRIQVSKNWPCVKNTWNSSSCNCLSTFLKLCLHCSNSCV